MLRAGGGGPGRRPRRRARPQAARQISHRTLQPGQPRVDVAVPVGAGPGRRGHRGPGARVRAERRVAGGHPDRLVIQTERFSRGLGSHRPRMATLEEQIKSVEDEIQKTPYNKATQHHIGKLKAKLARLKDEMEPRRLKSGGRGPSYAVKKSGNATVGLVGFPSVGKPTLPNQTT